MRKDTTSTISTFPVLSKSPASWALSTLKGRLPTKSLRSGEKPGSSSPPSLRTSSSWSKSDETATLGTKRHGDDDDKPRNPLAETQTTLTLPAYSLREAKEEGGEQREERESEVGLEAKRERVLGVREARAREEEAEADMVSISLSKDKVCVFKGLGF